MNSLILMPAEGRRVKAGGMTVTYKSTSEMTDDAVGIYHLRLDPGSPGAGPHRHEVMTEMFHVLDGTLSMLLDGAAVEVGPGSFVVVPPKVPHAFANHGAAPVSFMLTFTPALSREGFFEGMATLSDEDRMGDEAAMLALMARYDQTPLDGIGGWTKAESR